MKEIIDILKKDARTTPEEIAKMLNMSEKEVKSIIKDLEDKGVIIGYKTVFNEELKDSDSRNARALIEVNVVPQKNAGFDSLAERIYKFKEVTSCYLLSGTYDLLLIVEGKDLNEVANFVAEKLAPMENVKRTVTHFLLKKYKEDGVILDVPNSDKRLAITF